jgi:hypothetical protein
MPVKVQRKESLEVLASPFQPRAEGAGASHAPTREEIRRLAHAIYFERGGGAGHELDDWLQAERELEAEFLLAEAAIFLLQV